MNTPKNQTLLIVDDEQDILDFLSYNLKKEGFHIFTAKNGEEAIDLVAKINPSLVLLDLMMPKMDGIETCQYIRNELKLMDVLIVFLTSRAEDYSQIAGFEVGADDYINKPIRPRLLVSKIQSLLRRGGRSYTDKTHGERSGNQLVINRDKFVAELNGTEIILPKKEFELLELLASRPGKVFTRDQILANVWGNDTIVGERTIDVHVRKLREKLGDDYIRTMKGVGYTFSEN